MARAKKVVRKKRPTGGRTAKKKSAKKRPSPRKRADASRRAKKPAAFGRVKIPVDARLDVVFQKDYQAREIFDFLRIQTIRELEQFGPDQIIERLAGPVYQTVQRIRKSLALANRHLAKDEKFAKAFLAEVRTGCS